MYSVGCHEIGHTVGLAHDNDTGYTGCMRANISGTTAVWGSDQVAHVNSRRQLYQPGGNREAVDRLLVDLQVRSAAARLLVYRAAAMVDEGIACLREASIANLYATEALVKATSDAMRVWGGGGIDCTFTIERTLRDARLFIIGDGSSQIQRNLIARQMGL